MGRIVTGRIDLRQYARRLDQFDYKLKHNDLPRDSAELLELAKDGESTDKENVDVTDVDV